jgi:hypothetical protein
VCGFCGTLVGFTWQASAEYVLCNQCHREHKFPSGPAEFTQQSVSREFWAQFDSEVAAQDQQEIDAPSALSSEEQQKLLGLVVEFG